MENNEGTQDPLGRDPFSRRRDSVWNTPPAPLRVPAIMGGDFPSASAPAYAEPPWTPVENPPPPVQPAGESEPDPGTERPRGKEETIMIVAGIDVAGELYGVDVMSIREIIRMRRITPAPKSSPHVTGVISLRGEIIPVIPLRARFDFPGAAATKLTRIVVLDLPYGLAGLVADAVTGLFRLPESAMERTPRGARRGSDYITGVARAGERLIALLDVAKVLDIH